MGLAYLQLSNLKVVNPSQGVYQSYVNLADYCGYSCKRKLKDCSKGFFEW